MKYEVKLTKDEECINGECSFFEKNSLYCLGCKVQRLQNIIKTIKVLFNENDN